MNKKEAKTWLSYAKLNQIIFQHKNDEVSFQHIMKSYMSAITLCMHKSRFIVPQVFKLIKKRTDLNEANYKECTNALRRNLEQMPTWIWLFWIPQILQMFFYNGNQVETMLSRVVLDKICKLYPQTIYFQLKSRIDIFRMAQSSKPPGEDPKDAAYN